MVAAMVSAWLHGGPAVSGGEYIPTYTALAATAGGEGMAMAATAAGEGMAMAVTAPGAGAMHCV